MPPFFYVYYVVHIILKHLSLCLPSLLPGASGSLTQVAAALPDPASAAPPPKRQVGRSRCWSWANAKKSKSRTTRKDRRVSTSETKLRRATGCSNGSLQQWTALLGHIDWCIRFGAGKRKMARKRTASHIPFEDRARGPMFQWLEISCAALGYFAVPCQKQQGEIAGAATDRLLARSRAVVAKNLPPQRSRRSCQQIQCPSRLHFQCHVCSARLTHSERACCWSAGPQAWRRWYYVRGAEQWQARSHFSQPHVQKNGRAARTAASTPASGA